MQTTVMCKNASQYCTACLSIILHDSKLNQLIRFNTCTLRIPLTFKHVENNDMVNSYVLTIWIWYKSKALYSVSNMLFIIPIWYSQYVWCYYLILQALSMKAVPNANTLSKQKVLVTFILCRIYTTNNIRWTS